MSSPLARRLLTVFIVRIAYIKDKLVVISEKTRRLNIRDKLYDGSLGRDLSRGGRGDACLSPWCLGRVDSRIR